MEYLLGLAILALVIQSWRSNYLTASLVATFSQHLQETDAYHAAQVAELCNRIQLPERTAHVSISESAPPPEPYIDPDLAEEMSILGEN